MHCDHGVVRRAEFALARLSVQARHPAAPWQGRNTNLPKARETSANCGEQCLSALRCHQIFVTLFVLSTPAAVFELQFRLRLGK